MDGVFSSPIEFYSYRSSSPISICSFLFKLGVIFTELFFYFLGLNWCSPSSACSKSGIVLNSFTFFKSYFRLSAAGEVLFKKSEAFFYWADSSLA
jgi:hypothetical protein